MLLDIKGLSYYKRVGGLFGGRVYKIIDNVSFPVSKDSSTVIYGDKYSGKYYLARMIVNLIKPTSGEVIYKGRNILKLSRSELSEVRRKLQLVFGDPIGLFDEGMTILGNIKWVGEIAGIKEYKQIFLTILDTFKMSPEVLDKYPSQLSILEKRILSIARSLILDPDVLILENPTMLIEWSRRDEIIRNIELIKREYGLSILIFTSDLKLVKSYGDYTGFLHMGRLIEYGLRDDVIKDPLHPFVKWLLNQDPRIMDVEDLTDYDEHILDKYIDGCRFMKCIHRTKECDNISDYTIDGRLVKCILFRR